MACEEGKGQPSCFTSGIVSLPGVGGPAPTTHNTCTRSAYISFHHRFFKTSYRPISSGLGRANGGLGSQPKIRFPGVTRASGRRGRHCWPLRPNHCLSSPAERHSGGMRADGPRGSSASRKRSQESVVGFPDTDIWQLKQTNVCVPTTIARPPAKAGAAPATPGSSGKLR